MRLFLLLITCLSCLVMAAHVAVLETGADPSVKERVSLPDRQYLTNVLREEAVKQLPAAQGYTIMTRENISAMLPPGKAIEDCEGSCLAETGRNIAADYICQARVSSFGAKLTLSAELYETAGNKLLASFNGRGADVEELLDLIKEKSPDFFRSIKDGFAGLADVPNVEAAAAAPVEEPKPEEPKPEEPKPEEVKPEEPQPVQAAPEEPKEETPPAEVSLDKQAEEQEPSAGESIPANVNDEPAKKGGIHWVPLSLSAVVTTVGVIAAVKGNIEAKKSSEKTYTTVEEYEKYHQDALDYQTTRTVGTIIAIVGAVGIGLSIAF